MVKKIDQSEFEGFEYINPLLMSAEECVWGMWQLYRRAHTHTCIHTHSHSCTCYMVSRCPRAAWLWDSLMTSTRSGAAHAQQNAYLPKPVWHSAIYNHLPLSLPSFLIIFISCKSALISILSSGGLFIDSRQGCKVLPRFLHTGGTQTHKPNFFWFQPAGCVPHAFYLCI